MTDKIFFEAHLFSVKKDKDGEVKLTLIIPKIYQLNVMNLPEEKVFKVSIEGENAQS